MEQLILELAQKHPGALSVFVVVGVLRAIFKPLMSLAEAYVEATPSPDDNSKLAKFKESKFYKAVAYLLDYAASIKLPK